MDAVSSAGNVWAKSGHSVKTITSNCKAGFQELQKRSWIMLVKKHANVKDHFYLCYARSAFSVPLGHKMLAKCQCIHV